MSRLIFLDSTPLGLITQHRRTEKVDAAAAWLERTARSGSEILVPAIVYYELKRELLRADKPFSVRRLELFVTELAHYVPMTDQALHFAAERWAKSRNEGRPTAAPEALDIDVILAAQVLTFGVPTSDVVVATSNKKHLAQFVPAKDWSEIL